MKRPTLYILASSFIALTSGWAQESPSVADRASEVADKAAEVGREVMDKASEVGSKVADKAVEVRGKVADTAAEVSGKVADTAAEVSVKVTDTAAEVADRATELANSEQGLKATDTILEWIEYADKFYQPWMNWALVAIGIGLFVSHGGQLVVGKFWGVIRGRGFNFCEAFNDLLVTLFSGLALPAVIVISTPVTVLSAAAVGILIGMALYTHGMKQEALAANEAQDLTEEAEGA